MSVRSRWSRKELACLALILAVAFGLRLAAVLQYEHGHPNAAHPSIDEAAYDGWARAIAGGDWIGKGVFFQEPLYPYALGSLYAVFGPHPFVARVFQCLLWAATAGLVASLARRLFSRAAGWIAAGALAIYWPGILFPSFLLKENLFLPLLALLALVLVATREVDGRRLWLVAGLLAGLGALLRGNLLVLLPVLGIWPMARAWRRRSALAPAVARAGIFLAGSACVLLPVALRNLAVGGEFLLTTSGAGTNLYGGNNLENPYGRATEPGFVRAIPEHEAADWRHEAERRLGRPLAAGEVSAFWRGEALRSFADHPREHLAMLWNKLRLSLGRYEVPDDHCLYWDARYVALARAPWPGFGIVGVLGLAGLLLFAFEIAGARNRRFAVLDPGAALEVALLFLAYLGTIVLTVTSDRARLPLVPLLLPFAAWTLVAAGRAVVQRSQDAFVRLALAIFVGVLAVHVRVLPDAEIAEDLDERDYNLAVQLEKEDGKSPAARAIAERLVARHERSARARILLAEIESREDPAAPLASLAALRGDSKLNPRERFRAASLVGWIQLERGAWSEAEAAFRDARAFDAEARDLREGLARALLGQADGAEPKLARTRSEEALDLLRGDSSTLDGLLAQAEFFVGRAILDGPPANDEEAKLGKSFVQAALKRLQALVKAESTPADVRRRGRLLAGSIQLYRRNWKQAENHFRAAIALSDGPDAEVGLLRALLAELEGESSTGDRSKAIEEIQTRFQQLGPDTPGLDDLRRRVESLR
jgi:4-amino-4-deoxy-L-arabinose transferase-like glycosyltransferase